MTESASQFRPLIRYAAVAFMLLFGLMGGALLAEIVARLSPNAVSPSGGITYRNFAGYYTYQREVTFDFKNEARREVSFATDEFGLRNPRGFLASADTIVLGDSFIAAVNTPAELTVAGQLRAAGIAAYNAGVDGTSTFNQFYLLRDHLANSAARTVVVGFYLGNDFRDNYWGDFIEPQEARTLPARVTPKSTPNVASLAFDLACRISELCRRLRDRGWIAVQSELSRDPMGSYASSELLMLEDAEPHAEIAIRRTFLVLEAMKQITVARDAHLVVMGIPSKAEVLRSFREVSGFADDPQARPLAQSIFNGDYSWDQPDKVLADLCDQLDIPYVSLLADFRTFDVNTQLYFNFDPHWREIAQQRAAQALARKLRELLLDKSAQ